MEFIDWDSTLSVSNDMIDSQHKRLITLINQLFVAMTEGKGNDVMAEIFEELIDYTKTHFSEEEVLMAQNDYPQLEWHKKEHLRLQKQVLDFYEKFKLEETTLSISVLNFLRAWLSNHILSTDKLFGDFMIAKSLM